MAMEKVRVGIVGSKFAADFHCDSYSRNDYAEVVAVAAIDNLDVISPERGVPYCYREIKVTMLNRKKIVLPDYHDLRLRLMNRYENIKGGGTPHHQRLFDDELRNIQREVLRHLTFIYDLATNKNFNNALAAFNSGPVV